MIALRIRGATTRFAAPPGMDNCRDLWVRVENGCCVSAWEPTPDELATLNAGGSVELWVVGMQPPVALMVRHHIENGGEEFT
jgi:hypothetical protein